MSRIELVNVDFAEFLQYTTNRYRMVFADPPDNINLGYDGYKDKVDNYQVLLSNVLSSTRICSVLWLSFNPIHIPLVGHLTHEFLNTHPDWEFKPCVQTFTFGQHNHRDLGVCHRPLYRFLRRGTQLYPDAIRVPSWRQLNGDKRADPRGRVPGDVFDFPRVTGNSKQRRSFSPTQLHEGLYERCIRLSCSRGDDVLDLFAGSGTLGRVATRCGVGATMLEVSRSTCDAILADQPDCEEWEWATPGEWIEVGTVTRG